MDRYDEEIKLFRDKVRLAILPSFNNEWVIETYSAQDELTGRINVTTVEDVVNAVQTALQDGPEYGPEVN